MQESGTIMKQDRRSTKLSAAQKKKLILIIAAAAVLITAAVIILRKSVSEKYGKSSPGYPRATRYITATRTRWNTAS